MIFWILTILMMAAAVLCVLVPLSRERIDAPTESRAEIYADQLEDLEKNNAGKSASERALVERRLLAALEDPEMKTTDVAGNRTSLIVVSLAALIAIPAFTMATYLSFGTPSFSAFQQAVAELPVEQQSVAQLVAAAEKQLEKNPDDLRGWTVVAGVYGRTGQFDRRVNALRQIMRLSNPNAPLLAELGEARTLANGGVVSQQAVSDLQEAIKLDPANTKAKVYLLLATEQEGKLGEALKGWRDLQAAMTEEGPWRERIGERIASLENRMSVDSQPGPTREQVDDAAALPSADRQAMIEGMVAGLAQKLEDQPDDIDGWLRLLRSYRVLDRDKAFRDAWSRSIAFYAGREAELERLMAAAKGLGYTVRSDGTLEPGASQ